jgi:hypothetical protein
MFTATCTVVNYLAGLYTSSLGLFRWNALDLCHLGSCGAANVYYGIVCS